MSLKKKLIHFSSRFGKDQIEDSYPLDFCLPVYHLVSNEELPHLRHIIQYKNSAQFEQDLDYMQKFFRFVSWDEFKDFNAGKFRSVKKIALLTFDDGLREFYDVVIPILEQKGIYAMNFINPKFIDNQDLMFRCKTSLIIDSLKTKPNTKTVVSEYFQLKNASEKDLIRKLHLINYHSRNQLDEIAEKTGLDFQEFLKNQQPYLTKNQLKKLVEKGFGIGAHSWDHPLYFELSTEEQLEKTQQSLDYLEKSGFPAESFAFPFTDFGIKQEFFTELFRNGNLFCSFGSAGIKNDSFPRNFQRIPMETGEPAEEILKDQITYFNLKKIFYKNTIRRS